MDSLECNNADIHWYVRMQVNPPPVDLKGGMLYQIVEKMPFCNQSPLRLILGFHIEMDRYVCWN